MAVEKREGSGKSKGQEARDAAQKVLSIFETVEEFEKAANGYFAACDEQGVLYGEAGLALYLTEHNREGRIVTLATLRRWYDGGSCEYLQEAVQLAYLRIQSQVETDARYSEKAMVTRGIFLQKQARFGGYQDKIEARQDISVNVNMGSNMDKSDWE